MRTGAKPASDPRAAGLPTFLSFVKVTSSRNDPDDRAIRLRLFVAPGGSFVMDLTNMESFVAAHAPP